MSCLVIYCRPNVSPLQLLGGAIDRACCYFCKVDRILGKRAIDRNTINL
ncbi:MAG: hypothetical protein ACRC62_24370 [Microcoleus sp.]